MVIIAIVFINTYAYDILIVSGSYFAYTTPKEKEVANQLPAKDPNVLDKVRKALQHGKYRYTDHAMTQMTDRAVNSREVRYILESGYHEATKDEFDIRRDSWKYALRGNTVDGRDIRVVVGFANLVMIITVIDKDN